MNSVEFYNKVIDRINYFKRLESSENLKSSEKVDGEKLAELNPDYDGPF